MVEVYCGGFHNLTQELVGRCRPTAPKPDRVESAMVSVLENIIS